MKKIIHNYLEVLYAQIFDILLDSGSAYWAAAYVGEGHPDVGVYKDAQLLLATDVYPNSISTVAWRNHQLYCVTGAYLEYGLTRAEREKHPQFRQEMAEGREERVMYRIDPATGRAEHVSTTAAELVNHSHDQQYTLTMQAGQDAFTFTVASNRAGKLPKSSRPAIFPVPNIGRDTVQSAPF